MPSEARLEAIIATALPGAEVIRHKPLEGGVSADVTMLEVALTDGARRKCVLREHGERHCGHPAAVEFELLHAIHSLGLPVAEPLGFGPGGNDKELPWVLIAYVEGTTPVPADKADTRIDAMADQLFAVHSVPSGSLPDLPLRIDPQPELLEFLPDTSDWASLRGALQRMGPQPAQSVPALLHGDFWPANIIFENDAVKAVIDWEDAAVGDPLSDVACAMLELRYIYGPWGAERFLATYSKHTEVDPKRLALWQAYVAAAGARSMGEWGLDPARVERMQQIAFATVREAAETLGI